MYYVYNNTYLRIVGHNPKKSYVYNSGATIISLIAVGKYAVKRRMLNQNPKSIRCLPRNVSLLWETVGIVGDNHRKENSLEELINEICVRWVLYVWSSPKISLLRLFKFI